MTTNLDAIVALLAERYDDLGVAAGARLGEWLSGSIPLAYPEMLERHLAEEHVDLLFDAFWQVLPVGTGGRRGRVGYGANRLNPTTVAMTVQGHCNYLRDAFPDREHVVVVANDVREFHDIAGVYGFLGDEHPLLGASSRTLGRLACEIYAANGIRAYFAQPREEFAVLSTPELAYLISELGATGGINLSASHNPPDDNGVKIYDEFGSQPVAPQDQRLVEAMDRATEVRSTEFAAALDEGMILAIPDELHGRYIATYVDLYGGIHEASPDVPVVYTPMCGCGGTTIREVLVELGFPVLVPDGQGEPDGTFQVIPFKVPNPEVPQSTEPAKAFADAHGSGLVLSSDPDADRVGLEMKDTDGQWVHFDGNQIAAVFCYYLMLDPEGPRRRGLVIETLVTTKILGEIVRRAGDSYIIDDLLVGFKYVADVLKELERTGTSRGVTCSPEQLVLAAEESHGVICIPTIRDKDATPACMYLAALYQRLAANGETLLDYYTRILEELGGFDNVNRSIMLSGAQGMLQKDGMMASLREDPPTSIAGHTVNEVVDYWDTERFGEFVSDTDRLPRNVVQAFTDAFVLTVRPSGTEPKLKLYCQLLPHGEPSGARGAALLDELRSKASDIARFAYKEMLTRVNLELGEAGLLLPDIIDFHQKRRFDIETAVALGERIASGELADLDATLGWLGSECAEMTPGADPVPALTDAVAHLCGQWPQSALRDELLSWATPGS